MSDHYRAMRRMMRSASGSSSTSSLAEGSSPRGSGRVAQLEHEVQSLRTELAAAKIEIAELKGEREELRHELRRASAAPRALAAVRSGIAGASQLLTDVVKQRPSCDSTDGGGVPTPSDAEPAAAAVRAPPQTVSMTERLAILRTAVSQGASSLKKTFAGLDTEALSELVALMSEMVVRIGDVVVREGEEGDTLFLVVSGELEVSVKLQGDKPVHTYCHGEAFGELALLYRSPRKATVRCRAGGTLLVLERAAYQRLRQGQQTASGRSRPRGGASGREQR